MFEPREALRALQFMSLLLLWRKAPEMGSRRRSSPLRGRLRAFAARLLPSAGHSWNWRMSPPSAGTGSSRPRGEGPPEASSGAAAPAALSSLCGGRPQDLSGAEGRDCFRCTWPPPGATHSALGAGTRMQRKRLQVAWGRGEEEKRRKVYCRGRGSLTVAFK